MKIYQVSFGDGYAGSAKIALLSSELLMNRGYDITLFVTKNSLTEKRSLDKNINTVSFDTSLSFKDLYEKVKTEISFLEKPIFIAYHSLERKLGIRLKRKLKEKIINVAYRQNMSKTVPIIGPFLYNNYSDAVLACSQGVADDLVRTKIKKEKVKTIHNGIYVPENINEISGDNIRSKYGLKNKFVLGLTSWYHRERKGFDILFEAFKHLDEIFVLLLVGIPEDDQQKVIDDAESFGINKERIILPGYVENIWEYYKAMDIFLLPSRSEGFSLALLEAAASKVPLIASNISVNREFIIDDQNGRIFDIQNPKELTDVIVELSQESEKRIQLSNKAFSDVMNNHTLKHYADKFESILDTVSREN